jgi:hypothetical protein
VAGNEVGMEMGLQDVGDLQSLITGGVDVDLDVSAGVDDGARFVPADEVGTVSDAFNEELMDDHRGLLKVE